MPSADFDYMILRWWPQHTKYIVI